MPPVYIPASYTHSQTLPAGRPPSLRDEEDPEDYVQGGYLNVKIGDAFSSPNQPSPYTVIRKLGWGHFSTVWLVQTKHDRRYTALKVCSSKYGTTAKDEILLLEKVRKRSYKCLTSRHGTTEYVQYPGAKHVVTLLDYFSTRGRYKGEEHICMVLEPLGENLLSLLDRYRGRRIHPDQLTGIPMPLVRIIAKQVLMGLQFLHDECSLVHTDIKPENILVCLPDPQRYIRVHLNELETLPSQRVAFSTSRGRQYVEIYYSQPMPSPPPPIGAENDGLSDPTRSSSSSRSRSREIDLNSFSVQISDLGNATPADEHFTEDIQTRQYRAPEAIIRRNDWGCAVDIWSVACMIFELATGDHLFDPRAKAGLWEKDDDHMAQIIELCGDFDLELKMGGKFSREIFTSRGHLRHIHTLKPITLTQLLTETYNYPYREAKRFASFLTPMLKVDPSLRATAAEMLTHEWLGRWDSNDYSRHAQAYDDAYEYTT